MVNTTWGTQVTLDRSVTAGSCPRARAAIASPQTRPWYLPMWVSSARWLTSPAAYSQPPATLPTRSVSSASSHEPGTSPTASRPMSSVRGARPVAASTSSAVTVVPSPSVSVTFPSRLAPVTLVPSRTSTPASRSPSATRSPTKPGSRSSSPPRASSVTCAPSACHATAISQATTPPPTMASRPGAACALVASRLVHGFTAASGGGGAGGHHDRVPCPQFGVADLHDAVARDPARAAKQVDPRLLQPFDLAVVFPVVREGVAAGQDRRGIEARADGAAHAVGLCYRRHRAKQRLARHARPVRAFAADELRFHDRRAKAAAHRAFSDVLSGGPR